MNPSRAAVQRTEVPEPHPLRNAYSDRELSFLAYRAMGRNQADGAAIAFGDDQAMTCVATRGTAPPIGTMISRDGSGLSAHCLRTGETVLCTDTWTDLRIDPTLARQHETRSVAIVPLFAPKAANAQILGLVEVFASRPNAFDAQSLEYLQRLAGSLTGEREKVGAPTTATAASPSREAEQPAPVASVAQVIDRDEPRTVEPEALAAQADDSPDLRTSDEPLFLGPQDEARWPKWSAILALVALIGILLFIAVFPSR